MPAKRNDAPQSVNRRRFLGASVSAAAIPFVGKSLDEAVAQPVALETSDSPIVVALSVNGDVYRLGMDVRRLCPTPCGSISGLTGSKRAVITVSVGPALCISTECGFSCLTLAIAAQGRQVSTVEALARADGPLHPMQQAFVDNDAFQCGYCTPGQIMSAIGCVKEGHASDEDTIREYMSGNLCRSRLIQTFSPPSAKPKRRWRAETMRAFCPAPRFE